MELPLERRLRLEGLVGGQPGAGRGRTWCPVEAATLADDGRSVFLKVKDLRAGDADADRL